MSLVRAATYHRQIPTSIDRVWENVRDWEHLPWLHASSFRSIELVAEGTWGWRARLGRQPTGSPILIELCIDAERSRYVARTLEGELRGAEVWTTLREARSTATDVAVEFWVPDLGPPQVKAVANGYLELYRQLWDEDETMMVGRAEALAAVREPAADERDALRLGDETELRERLPVPVTWQRRPFRVVEVDGELALHATRCPHRLGPLDAAPVQDGCVVCPWHGYRFDVRSGTSADGRALQLDRPPVLRRDADGTLWLSSPMPRAVRDRAAG